MAEAVGAVVLSEEQCDQLWNGYLNEHNIENDEQLANHLQARGLDDEALHWQLELPAKVQQHSRERFSTRPKPVFWRRRKISTGWFTACCGCATASWLGALSAHRRPGSELRRSGG